MEFITDIFKIVSRYYPLLIGSLGMTLLLTLITVVSGVILGTLICLARDSKYKIVSLLAKAFVDIVRGTPLLLQLTFFYFAFDGANSFIRLDKFSSICLALAINSSAYVAEIIRSGISSIDKGQYEAAISLGLNKSQAMKKVILPQAIRNILPALGNEFISVSKETSLASTFFIGDLMTAFKTISGTTFIYLPLLTVIGIIYFIITFAMGRVVSFLERKYQTSAES